jgi:hypothetical protein
VRRYWAVLLVGLLLFASSPLFIEDLSPSRMTRMLAGLALLLGGLGVLWAVTRLSERGLQRAGLGHLRPAVLLGQVIGVVLVMLVALSAAGFRLTGILTGTTVLTVILGLAAQSLLANVMAGLVLASSRAFRVGDALTVRSWAFGGVEYGGRVSDLTLTHTVLRSAAGTVKVPNSRFLDATLTLHPNGAGGVVLRFPPGTSIADVERAVRGRAQVLPMSLSGEGWEVTLYCPEDSAELFQDLETLFRTPVAKGAAWHGPGARLTAAISDAPLAVGPRERA